jgi:hypothetical protein
MTPSLSGSSEEAFERRTMFVRAAGFLLLNECKGDVTTAIQLPVRGGMLQRSSEEQNLFLTAVTGTDAGFGLGGCC